MTEYVRDHLAERAGGRAAPAGNAPRALLVLRVVVTLNTVAIFAQAWFAGLMLTGDDQMFSAHAVNAQIVSCLTLLQVVVAVLLWRPARGPWWPVAVSVVLAAAMAVQFAVGHGQNLAVHVPLGIAVLGIAVALSLWAWLPTQARAWIGP